VKLGDPSPVDVARALSVLTAAGAVVQSPPRRLRLFSISDTADMLSVSANWVREHLSDFPGAVDLGGGTKEIRIPESDVIRLVDARRLFPEGQ